MTPDVLSHYRVLRPLGAGGMGQVYLGEDSRLGRNVAIKVLPGEFAEHPDRLRRFEQEARAASALNHPNILTIYDIGRSGDTPFIVTEYIEGETLRQRLSRGRLPLDQVLHIATQAADALGAAHRAGIVHRDIKPENIMVRGDGWVKVLDFGLAKLTEQQAPLPSEDAPTVARSGTASGVIVGTVRYMSPEQARGLAVDSSTDVFSLGIVLYEMLAGRAPFGGETATDVIVAILQNDPPPLERASAVPGELERIVFKALSKDRNSRYRNAAELSDELKRFEKQSDVGLRDPEKTALLNDPAPASSRSARALMLASLGVVAAAAIGVSVFRGIPAGRETIDTLAVLPFASAAKDDDAESLSDGITESLINDLSQLPDLKVMSRNAVWRYRNASSIADAKSVGRDLNVRAVLSGRVARRNDRLLVSVELVDARDDTQIWGEHYDRSMSDVLAVQDDIVGSIAETLRLKLSGDERRLLARRETENTEAYERYLKGRYYLNKRSADAIRKGRDFFQQAIDYDPAYALAYSGVSDAYALLASLALIAPDEAYPAALSAARKAIELDPSLAEGHASLAHAALHSGDPGLAEKEFARALALKPNYVPTYLWQAELMISSGKLDDAMAIARKALAIDPLDLVANAQLGLLLMRTRQYDRAIAQLKKTLEIDPNYFLAHAHLGATYMEMNRFPEAIAEYTETARLTGGSRGLGGLGITYAKAGLHADARRIAAQMEARANEHYTSPLEIARVYAALEDKDATLKWLAAIRRERASSEPQLGDRPEFAFLKEE